MRDRHPDDPTMPIGMFSRASLVSVKALRSYHEMGLLVPDSVDPTTGYRTYRVSQLADAAIIKRLRDLDVPLREIARVVEARDPEVTREVVERQRELMHARLADVERMVRGLHDAVALPSQHTPIHVRDEPEVHALARHGSVSNGDYAPFLDEAYGSLYAATGACGLAFTGPGSALYPAHLDTDDEPVEAYLPLDGPITVPPEVAATGVVLTIVPAARCAVATHVGGYDTVGETYRQLGAWVAHHATSADQPVREHYVVSVDPSTGALLPDDQLRTEIAWPITDH